MKTVGITPKFNRSGDFFVRTEKTRDNADVDSAGYIISF